MKHNLESICSYSLGLFDIVWYSLLPHWCDKRFFCWNTIVKFFKIILVLNFPLRGNNSPHKEYSTSFPIKLFVSGFMTTVLAIIWYLKTQRTVPTDQSIISAFFSGGVGWSNLGPFIRLKFSSRDCICGGGGYCGEKYKLQHQNYKNDYAGKKYTLIHWFWVE